MKNLIIAYIIDQIANKDDKDDLYNSFVALDTDGNGILTRSELIEGYSKVYPDLNNARVIEDVDKIFEVADRNKTGMIAYSGNHFFLTKRIRLCCGE